VDIIKLLLDKGMSVNLTNMNGSTRLHVSAQFDHLDATKTWVEFGAARDYTDSNGTLQLWRLKQL